MNASSARSALTGRAIALAALAVAFVVTLASVSFAFAAPSQAYADSIAWVGSESKSGTPNLYESVSEINKAIAEFSSQGEKDVSVEFVADVAFGSGDQLVVPKGMNVTVYLSGHMIDGSRCNSAGFVSNASTLVISGGSPYATDSLLKHEGYIDQTKSCGKLWKAGTNESKQEAVIEGGLLTGFRHNAVASATSDANITLKDLTIAGDTESASVLINHWRCNLKLVNTTIKWNFSNQGGGIEVGSSEYISRNNITLDNSTVSENVGGDGGGICVWRAFETHLSLTNSSHVTSNYAAGLKGVDNTGSGGGIFFSTHSNDENNWRDDNAFSDSSSINITGGSEVSGNVAFWYGGGIYAMVKYKDGTSVRGKRTITMDGGSKISGNQGLRGGGVYLLYDERTYYPQYPYMEFLMKGASEVSNNSAKEGGGFYIEGSAWQQLTLRDKSHIDDNTATVKSGGGVYTTTRLMDITMVGGSTINNNNAAQSGGGIFEYDKSLNLSMDDGSQINGNSAQGSEGGGICTYLGASAKIEMFNSSQISGNRAAVRGGGLSLLGTGGATIGYDETSDEYSDEELGTGTISYNAVLATDKETKGGGIYTNATLSLRNMSVDHNSLDSTKSSGGGVFVDNTTATIINSSITDNKTAGTNGGGVEVASRGAAARAVFGGVAVVRDNTNGGGSASDVHIGEKSSNKTDVENDNNQLNNRISESTEVPIADGSRIGLQHWTGTDATKHAMSPKGEKIAADEDFHFFSDDPAWRVDKINDAIWLVNEPGFYKVTVYAGKSEPSLSEASKAGSTEELESKNYTLDDVWPDYWMVQGLGATTRLNPDANGVTTFTMPSNDVTLTAHYPSKPDEGDLFDKLVTSFPKASISHAAACKDKAVATVQYKLKNGSTKTADITWDFSGVDDTMTSGEFTIKGSFTDTAGTKHEVSQAFVLMGLHAPAATPNDIVYEQSQQVTLSLDSSFEGVEGAEIWYCVDTSDVKPAASDYKLYSGPFTVEKGDYQVVHAYAKVGQRQTDISEFDYVFSDRHAVKVNSGKAVDADGKAITSAFEGEDVRIVADAPAEGKSFKEWVVTNEDVPVEDATSAETTFYMGSEDAEITATYLTATYTVTFDTQGGSIVAAQTVEHGSLATTPSAPTRTGYAFKGWYADAACTQTFDFAQAIKGDTTVYAKWAGLVTVSFDAAGGSAVENRVIEQGAALGSLPGTTRTGYIFEGWYNGADRVTASTTFAQPATLTAHWEPVRLSVQFLNGSETYSAAVVDFGTTVSKPVPDPVKAGYTFAGWCSDSSLDTLYDFSAPVRSSMKLFAKWQINTYAVTFDAQGGSSVAAQTVEHGSVAAKPADPVRAGYAFKGWYADADFTTAFDFGKPITANTTVYAKWAQLVTVTFDADGGSEVASRQIEKGASLGDLPRSARTDYIFAGWYAGDAKVNAWTTFDADTKLVAHWDQNVYFVQYFDSDGETWLDVDIVTEGAKIAAPDPAPTRTGYNFVGWYADEGLTQPFEFGKTEAYSDLNLYAKWEIKRNQVTFDTQGGTAIEPRQVAYGDTVVEPDEPQRDGYFFEGWFADEGCTVEYNFSKAVTEPLTLYAKWAEKLVIMLDANGGSDAGNLVIPKGASVDAFPYTERTGYHFAGWYEGDAPVNAGKAFDKSTTLVAHWVPQQMIVTFMDGEDTYDVAIVDYDSRLARPADPVRAGYVFKGWYADEDCTVEYNFATPVTADITIYAKWAQLVTVSFDAAGGVGVDAVQIEAGSTLPELPTTTREGYVFNGWFAGGEQASLETVFDKDTTLTASWTKVDPHPSDPETPADSDKQKDPSTPAASDKQKEQGTPNAEKAASPTAAKAAASNGKQAVATSDGTFAAVAGLVAVASLAAAGCGIAARKRRRM